MITGLIGDISRYCTHDGPGIRTTVFFKGCPLRCPWCHNPEFLRAKPEIALYPEQCIGCGECLDICPNRAITLGKTVQVDRSLCTVCGLCIKDCPTKALRIVGRKYELKELEEIVLRDRLFYESSKGGVTLSGGEATMQLSFIGPFLQRLNKKSVHTALETSGYYNWDAFASTCLDYLDLILFDVKIADPETHKQILGVENTVILENLKKLLGTRPDDVIARIPLVPGYTDTHENLEGLAELFRKFKVRRCSLLSYNPYGFSKAAKIGRKLDRNLPQKVMNRSDVEKWHSLFTGIEIVKA